MKKHSTSAKKTQTKNSKHIEIRKGGWLFFYTKIHYSMPSFNVTNLILINTTVIKRVDETMNGGFFVGDFFQVTVIGPASCWVFAVQLRWNHNSRILLDSLPSMSLVLTVMRLEKGDSWFEIGKLNIEKRLTKWELVWVHGLVTNIYPPWN